MVQLDALVGGELETARRRQRLLRTRGRRHNVDLTDRLWFEYVRCDERRDEGENGDARDEAKLEPHFPPQERTDIHWNGAPHKRILHTLQHTETLKYTGRHSDTTNRHTLHWTDRLAHTCSSLARLRLLASRSWRSSAIAARTLASAASSLVGPEAPFSRSCVRNLGLIGTVSFCIVLVDDEDDECEYEDEALIGAAALLGLPIAGVLRALSGVTVEADAGLAEALLLMTDRRGVTTDDAADADAGRGADSERAEMLPLPNVAASDFSCLSIADDADAEDDDAFAVSVRFATLAVAARADGSDTGVATAADAGRLADEDEAAANEAVAADFGCSVFCADEGPPPGVTRDEVDCC